MASADRLIEVFNEAKARPAGAERERFLAEACPDDPALKEQVISLLRAHEGAGDFLKHAQLLSPASPLTEKSGDRIGRYKLLQQIGEGGCGVVYMAEQEEPVRRRVALKVIKLGMDTKSVIARFEAERQALALMDHPNIAKVFDAGATDTGRPYFVMELVRGIKITDYCDQNQLPTAERLKLFTQVCQAIQHAHQKGIIHRDVKPSNILVTISEPGSPGCPKVIDFGIAKATTDQRLTDETVFTAFEQFIGTPAYMSPEQAMMTSLDIDTRTDIYALGVLLYELLTGQTPFDAKDLMAAGLDAMRRIIREQEPARPSTRLSTMLAADLTLVARHRQAEPARLGTLLRGDLDWIVMKALEKDRMRRYETANGLAMDIQRHLSNEPVIARPPSNLYRFQKFVRRNKLAFAAVAAVATALVIGFGISTWLFFKEKQARQRASTEAAKSQQVAQFLTDMLQGVGPSVALGRDATMLREILDKTAGRIGKDLTNQPEVELELRATLADTYHELGLYRQMEAMARQGLRLARSQPGEENEDLADMLTRLGDALMHLGNWDESEKITSEALALQRKLLGNERLGKEQRAAAADSLDLLSHMLNTQGKLAEAETMSRESLALRKQLLGNEDPAVATSLESLAMVLADQHKLAEAETMSREALTMRRKLLGNEHPDVANSLNNLAYALREEGKLAEAETLFREALAMRKQFLGNEHPDVATSLNNLAIVLYTQRKLPEAESMYREALAMRKKFLGNENPEVATSLNNLANVLRDQGKLTEAETLLRQAVAMRKKFLGNEHPRVAESLRSLGNVLEDQSKWAEAESFVRELLAMRRRLAGNEPAEVADALNNLADLLEEQGKLAEAESMQREALSLFRKTSASNPSQEISLLGVVLHHLADLLRQRKALAEARPLAEAAVAIYQRHPDWPAAERQHALEVLVDVLTDLGDFSGLEALLREELADFRKLSTNDPAHELSELGVILHHLADVLRQRKALAEARALAEEAVTMYQRHPDWPSDERQHALAVLGDVLTDLGDSSALEALLREQLQTVRFRLALDDPELAAVIAQLTAALLGEKKFAEAEPLARECLTIREKKLPDDWRAFNARCLLGGSLLGQKQYAEAEPLLLSGYEGMKQRGDKIPAASKRYVKETLQRVVQLYEATGQAEKAAEWNRKLAEFEQAEAEKKTAVSKP